MSQPISTSATSPRRQRHIVQPWPRSGEQAWVRTFSTAEHFQANRGPIELDAGRRRGLMNLGPQSGDGRSESGDAQSGGPDPGLISTAPFDALVPNYGGSTR